MSFLICVRFCLNGLFFKTKISDHVEQLLLASPSMTLSLPFFVFFYMPIGLLQCKESSMVAASPFTQYNLGFLMKEKKTWAWPNSFYLFLV